MTRAARRAIPALLAVLTAILLSLALAAGPAVAADDAGGDHGTTAEASGFGSGQWDGMLLAAGAGLVMGLLAFAMSRPGEIDRVDAHHESPHGDQQMAT